ERVVGVAGVVPGERGRVLPQARRGLDLSTRLPDRLAGLTGLDQSELLEVAPDQTGDGGEQLGALGAGGVAPVGPGPSGRLHGAVDILLAGVGVPADGDPVRGGDSREGAAAARGDVVAVDQQRVVP